MRTPGLAFLAPVERVIGLPSILMGRPSYDFTSTGAACPRRGIAVAKYCGTPCV